MTAYSTPAATRFTTAFVLALLIVPAAAAQGHDHDEPLLTDPANDVAVRGAVAGTSVPTLPTAPAPALDRADLLELAIHEGDDALHVQLTATDPGDAGAGAWYVVWFTWRDTDYALIMEHYTYPEPFGTWTFAGLERRVAGGDLELVARFELEVMDGGTVAAAVPKVFITDSVGAAPGRGDQLTGVYVEAFDGFNWRDHEARKLDRMPDQGDAPFMFMRGNYRSGDVELRTDHPTRTSNGGSTTFVYRVAVTNTGSGAHTYRFAVPDAPAGWRIGVPESLKVPSGATKEVMVLASVPFRHVHGGFDSFNVTAVSTTDPATEARLRLGVLHTPIPMPAGHHDMLYLHADGPRNEFGKALSKVWSNPRGYLNTDPEHGTDTETAGTWWSRGAFTWTLPLNPGLTTGLDFDTARTGELQGVITTQASGAGTVTARLFLRDANDAERPLASSDAFAVNVAPDTPAPYRLTLTPTAAADYVAADHEANLVLEVKLTIDGATDGQGLVTAHQSTQAFSLKLPLNEYHDKVADDGAALSGLAIDARGATERLARPGATVLYPFVVTNTGTTSDTVMIALEGGGGAHAVVQPAGTFSLEPGASRAVDVVLTVPAEAPEGTLFELVVTARAAEDASRAAFARARTTVTLGDDAGPDDAALAAASGEAKRAVPGFGAVGVLALVAGAAVAVGRSRSRGGF